MTQRNDRDYVPREEVYETFKTEAQIRLLAQDEMKPLNAKLDTLIAQVGEINYRVKGIDGNGSGKPGLMQKLADQATEGFEQSAERDKQSDEKIETAIARLDAVEAQLLDAKTKKHLVDYLLDLLTQSRGVRLVVAIAGVCSPLMVIIGLFVGFMQWWNHQHPNVPPAKTTVVLPAPVTPTPAVVPTTVPSEQSEPKHKHH